MRQRLVIISILVCTAVGIQGIKLSFFPYVSGYAAYGFNSLILVLIFVTLALVLDQIYFRHLKLKRSLSPESLSKQLNRRRSFRITYPAMFRPRLIIEKTDRSPRRELEFAVIDLSQDGVCFNDDGSLGPAGSVSGCIKINNEKQLGIHGSIVRLKGNQVCVQFFHPISWTTLLAEQRRILQIQSVKKP